MTPQEIADWNAAKLGELQGDALEVATEVVGRWPGLKLVSCARDYKEQARAMAQNACAQRDNAETEVVDRLKWISDTYWPSTVARALQAWFEQNPRVSEPDCVDGFVGIMRAFPPDELRELSRHIVIRERDEGDGTGACCVDDKAEAFDVQVLPGPQDEALCTFLRGEAVRRSGRFLTKEGNEIRRHWQAK